MESGAEALLPVLGDALQEALLKAQLAAERERRKGRKGARGEEGVRGGSCGGGGGDGARRGTGRVG